MSHLVERVIHILSGGLRKGTSCFDSSYIQIVMAAAGVSPNGGP